MVVVGPSSPTRATDGHEGIDDGSDIQRGFPLWWGLDSFEIRDGIRRISCAVSDEALEAVSGLTTPSTVMLRRRSFDRFRTLINVAAELKLRTLPLGSIGPIVLTRNDLRRVPPVTGVPSFGSSAKLPTRTGSVVGGAPVSSAPT